MFIDVLIFAVIGKLLMFLWSKSPYPKYMSRISKIGSFFKELFACELCFGCWLYFGLDFVWQLKLISSVPVLSEFLDGIIVSFMVWIFTAGWNSLFRNFVITGINDGD